MNSASSAPFVSLVVVNWNGMAHTPSCVESLLRLRYPAFEVIVSDNGSTDGSPEAVESKFPAAKVVRNGANLGFGAAVMAALPHARGEYVAVLNNDLTVEPDWLEELVKVAELGYAAVASLILLEDRPTHVNGAGGEMSFLGLGWPRYYNQPATSVPQEPHEVTFCAGGVTLYERKAFEEVGGFDPAYFLYVEDADLSWKLRLAGHKLALAPKAALRHDWDFKRHPTKLYHIERNRLIMLHKNWSLGARIVLFPAFLLLEAAVVTGSILQGWSGHKMRAYRDAWREIRALRKAPRPPLRRVRERVIAKRFRGGIHYAEAANPGVKYVLNPLLGAYWWLAKPLLRVVGK